MVPRARPPRAWPLGEHLSGIRTFRCIARRPYPLRYAPAPQAAPCPSGSWHYAQHALNPLPMRSQSGQSTGRSKGNKKTILVSLLCLPARSGARFMACRILYVVATNLVFMSPLNPLPRMADSERMQSRSRGYQTNRSVCFMGKWDRETSQGVSAPTHARDST